MHSSMRLARSIDLALRCAKAAQEIAVNDRAACATEDHDDVVTTLGDTIVTLTGLQRTTSLHSAQVGREFARQRVEASRAREQAHG